MPRSRSRYRLAMLLALGALALPSPSALAQRFFRPQALADPPSQEVTAEFLLSESGGAETRKGTAWKVHYARGLHRGLYITGAWFKRDLSEDWMKVLNDARVSELFVPYHQHSYVRYFDLTGFSFPLAEVKAEDAGPFGTIMPPFQGDTYATVVKEIRDRGVIWKDYAHGVRRGRELVLWGALMAGNYMYLMSYAFHDDGTIALRVGATGQNLPGQRQEAARAQRALADRHGLGGRPPQLGDAHAPRRGPRQPGRRGHQAAVQRRHGRRRQLGPQGIHDDPRGVREEERAGRDDRLRPDAAARWDPAAQRAVHPPRPVGQPAHPERPLEYLFINLPNAVKDEEQVEQADIVLWCNSAVHHEPRNEDGKPGSGRRLWPGDDAWEGSALVMWSGVDLRPRNLFDRTPFYPYTPPPPPQQANTRPRAADGDDAPLPAPASEQPASRTSPDQRR